MLHVVKLSSMSLSRCFIGSLTSEQIHGKPSLEFAPVFKPSTSSIIQFIIRMYWYVLSLK